MAGSHNKLSVVPELKDLSEFKDIDPKVMLAKVNEKEGRLAKEIADLVDKEFKRQVESALNEFKNVQKSFEGTLAYGQAIASHTNDAKLSESSQSVNPILQKANEIANKFAYEIHKKVAYKIAAQILNYIDPDIAANLAKSAEEIIHGEQQVAIKININAQLATLAKKCKKPKDRNYDNNELAQAFVDIQEVIPTRHKWMLAIVPNLNELNNYIKNKIFAELVKALQVNKNQQNDLYPYQFVASNTRYYKFLDSMKNSILENHINEKYGAKIEIMYGKNRNEKKACLAAASIIYELLPALQVNNGKEKDNVEKVLADYFYQKHFKGENDTSLNLPDGVYESQANIDYECDMVLRSVFAKEINGEESGKEFANIIYQQMPVLQVKDKKDEMVVKDFLSDYIHKKFILLDSYCAFEYPNTIRLDLNKLVAHAPWPTEKLVIVDIDQFEPIKPKHILVASKQTSRQLGGRTNSAIHLAVEKKADKKPKSNRPVTAMFSRTAPAGKSAEQPKDNSTKNKKSS